jgi:hypothetical protein
MDGVRMARTFFDITATFGRGAVIDPASWCGCPRALMVSPLIGSQPLLSRLMRMHRYGLSRSSGLDRWPLHRVRSHQFKNLFQQRMHVVFQAIADEAWRNVSPRLITAQAIRASLFATATVTTRAGRLSSNPLIQAASSGLFLA